MASNGYVLVRVGKDHHLADVRGYAYEHRLVAEEKVGRRLEEGEQVHHVDGDPTNNDPSNLEVLTVREHRAEHRKRVDLRSPGEDNHTVECACGCGTTFDRYDAAGRPRQFVSGHNPPNRPTLDAIVSALAAGAVARSDIARRTDIPVRRIAVALSRLRANGEVQRVGVGQWRLVANGR